jgi:hypothetical protein
MYQVVARDALYFYLNDQHARRAGCSIQRQAQVAAKCLNPSRGRTQLVDPWAANDQTPHLVARDLVAEDTVER